MKIKPYKEEIICLVVNFLQQQLGQVKISQTLKKKYLSNNISDLIFQSNLLLQKGLIKTVKNYVQTNNKIKQYYINRIKKQKQLQNDKSEEDQEEQQKLQIQQLKPKKKKKINQGSKQKLRKKSIDSVKSKNKKQISVEKDKKQQHKDWIINRFTAPQKLQQIDVNNLKTNHKMQQEQNIDQQQSQKQQIVLKKSKKDKKEKKKKKIVVQQSSSQSQQESPVIKKSKKKVIQQKKVDKKQEKKKQKKVFSQTIQKRQNGLIQKKPSKPFSRINPNQVGQIRQQLKDNTFEAKYKYGKGDEWGKYGYQKLKDTRGDSFKKTKGKLKNRSFQGSNIDFNAVNSIPL